MVICCRLTFLRATKHSGQSLWPGGAGLSALMSLHSSCIVTTTRSVRPLVLPPHSVYHLHLSVGVLFNISPTCVVVRFDLLLPWRKAQQPATGLYAGYIWDGSKGRCTRPIRDPAAKSYMPIEQWPHDSYPDFASGCGFLMSHDLVKTLAEQAHCACVRMPGSCVQ